MRRFLLIILLAQVLGAVHLASQKAQRLPLQKKNIVLKSPERYEKSIVGYDPKTGTPIYYDPKPRVVLLDARSGTYALRWIGSDGQQKAITYHRPDAIDVIVSASVKRHSSGLYLYTYIVHSLPTSGQNVQGFAAQNFAGDVRPLKLADVYVGRMSNNKVMKEGNWLDFAVLGARPGIAPGRRVEYRLLSSAPPGLVQCRAVGITGMKGVGEEPPPELMDVLPGYEAWPSGYTIGPVDELKALSPAKRAEYIRQRLFQFQKLGWITRGAIEQYNRNLGEGKIEQLKKQAEKDLRGEEITTEFFALLTFFSAAGPRD